MFLLMVESCNVCSSLDVCLYFLDKSSLWSGKKFGRPATPVKIVYGSKFSPFGNNGSHCGFLESQRVINGFLRLMYFNKFLSHSFFRSWLSVLLVDTFYPYSRCCKASI